MNPLQEIETIPKEKDYGICTLNPYIATDGRRSQPPEHIGINPFLE